LLYYEGTKYKQQGIANSNVGNYKEYRDMAEKRSRPKNLTPTIKRLIYHRAVTQRDIPRDFLANTLIKEIEEIGEIPPSFETAKRYISKARNSANPIDEPWSIACCSEYNAFFPPDSIPVLMSYKQWVYELSKDTDQEYKDLFGVSMSDISIRHAIWIIRLKPLIEKTFADQMENNENIRLLYTFSIAMIYMIAEMTCDILDEHFISTGLDSALASGDLHTLSRIGGLGILAGSKPINCDGDCESCKYMRVPGFTKICMPRPQKEGGK